MCSPQPIVHGGLHPTLQRQLRLPALQLVLLERPCLAESYGQQGRDSAKAKMQRYQKGGALAQGIRLHESGQLQGHTASEHQAAKTVQVAGGRLGGGMAQGR